MSITIADESTVAALESASGPQEIRAADGKLLGQFIPASVQADPFPEFGVTVEELEGQLNGPNSRWFTPEEVMARLREIDQYSP